MVSKQNERETGEGRVLAGRDLALRLRARVSAEAMRWRQRNITPRLAVVWVEGDLASEQYAQTKLRSAEKLGISVLLDRHPGTVSQEALIASVEQLNRDPTVHGILLELPLPTHCQVDTVTQALDAKKDVDGLSRANHLALITGDVGLYPATPLACLRLLQHYGYDLVGKHVVLVGCGKTVGAPLLHLLLRARATVTVCHADTVDLTPHLKQADIALVAVGHPGLITKAMVHPGLTLIDVGINLVAEGKVVGDVDPQVAEYVFALTPTPGGVGAVTTVEIFANLMRAMAWQHQESWPEF